MNLKGKWINKYKKSSIVFENNTSDIEAYDIVYEIDGVIKCQGLLVIRRNPSTNDGKIHYGMTIMPTGFGIGGLGGLIVSENRKVLTIITISDPNEGTFGIDDSFEFEN